MERSSGVGCREDLVLRRRSCRDEFIGQDAHCVSPPPKRSIMIIARRAFNAWFGGARARHAAGTEGRGRDGETRAFRFYVLIVLNVLGTAAAGYYALGADARPPLHFRAIELLVGFAYLANLVYLLTSRDLNKSAVFGLTITLIGILQMATETEVAALLWIYTVPLLSFLLLEFHAGIIFNSALLTGAAGFLVIHAAGIAPLGRAGVDTLLGYAAVIVLASVSEIQRHHRVQTLERLSATDALTGVFNRRKLQELLESEIRRARRYGVGPAIVTFDIDRYKLINDRFGHPTGDEVLKHVVRVVQNHVRRTDSLVRLGGDEFLVLAPELITERALKMAEELRAVVKQNRFRDVPVSVSIGVAHWRRDENAAALLARADGALYRAKTGGRDRVACDPAGPIGRARATAARRHATAPAFRNWRSALMSPTPPTRRHGRSRR